MPPLPPPPRSGMPGLRIGSRWPEFSKTRPGQRSSCVREPIFHGLRSLPDNAIFHFRQTKNDARIRTNRKFILILSDQPLRLLNLMDEIKIYRADSRSTVSLPFADEGIRAGFPSPAQNRMDESIDLNRDIIHHRESTFYARVVGDSMRDANVTEGDILVVDRALTARNGDMAVCCLNGEFTVKYLELGTDSLILRPANTAYPPIRITEDEDFEVWGVVTYVIHKVQRRQP